METLVLEQCTGTLSQPLLTAWLKNRSMSPEYFLRAICGEAALQQRRDACVDSLFASSSIAFLATLLVAFGWIVTVQTWLWFVAGSFGAVSAALFAASLYVSHLSQVAERDALHDEDSFSASYAAIARNLKAPNAQIAKLSLEDIRGQMRERLVEAAMQNIKLERTFMNVPLMHWENEKRVHKGRFEQLFFLTCKFDLIDQDAGFGPFFQEATRRLDAALPSLARTDGPTLM